MRSLRDPIEFAADEDRDLQGIATWEPRSLVDRLLARYISTVIRAAIVLLGLLIFLGVSVLLLFQVLQNPTSLLFLVLFPLSLLPALALTGYVWYSDITSEPILTLIATYILGIVLASFPFLINTVVGAVIVGPLTGINPVLTFVVNAANFFLVVAPVEEVSKLAAVVTFVYWRDDFDTVVDGAVYGAIAGLGFATIENINFIIGSLVQTSSLPELLVAGGLITTVRSLAGPGHVIWTGIAGYYLGLAKFNREYALPLVVKGLFIASILHGVYNTVATSIGGVLGAFGTLGSLLSLPVSFGFIIVYHTVFFAYLIMKVRRYRKTYAEVSPGDHAADVDRLDGYEEMRAQATSDEDEDEAVSADDSRSEGNASRSTDVGGTNADATGTPVWNTTESDTDEPQSSGSDDETDDPQAGSTDDGTSAESNDDRDDDSPF